MQTLLYINALSKFGYIADPAEDPIWFIGQALGFLAVVLTFVSYQAKTPKKLLIVQTASTVSTMFSYLLIGAPAGMVLNAVCVVRNFIYYFREKKIFSYRFWPYLLAAVIGALGALSWEGPATLLLIFALMNNTIVLSFGNNRLLRWSILVTCSLIILYNIFVASYGGILNESVAIVSSVIALIRYGGSLKKNDEIAEVTEENRGKSDNM